MLRSLVISHANLSIGFNVSEQGTGEWGMHAQRSATVNMEPAPDTVSFLLYPSALQDAAMVQALPKLVTFAEFISWLPEDGCYELHDGTVIAMQPTGQHEAIAAFLVETFTLEYSRMGLPYRLPAKARIRPPEKESGYLPDVLLVDRRCLPDEPLWATASTLTQGSSIPLVCEVVSTNWRDDYHLKFADYEALGIPEYWIIDYAALGGRRLIGDPKQPTLTICTLIDGEYQVEQFRGQQPLISATFPNLTLTAAQEIGRAHV